MADKKGEQMSNETCTVTIADIYGADWWERNKAELERDWEWGFRIPRNSEVFASQGCADISLMSVECNTPRIILHRRKPKPPTLQEVYDTDKVPIPVGWEWAGEWTNKKHAGSVWLHPNGVTVTTGTGSAWGDDYRLILRERPKKVWFKAEDRSRCPRAGEYIWTSSHGWAEAQASLGIYLCATRHEEIDQTVQVVTQAMVDGVTR